MIYFYTLFLNGFFWYVLFLFLFLFLWMQILPLVQKYGVLHFNKTDTRLANSVPLDMQLLRCHANYHALRFAPHIEDLGWKLVKILQARGQFMVLHLRYEKDMLAFSGCTNGCTPEEADDLTRMRWDLLLQAFSFRVYGLGITYLEPYQSTTELD
jgi:hypothetical protein